MFAVGDVIAFWSDDAGKRKYHLCISFDGHFIFLNSPKHKSYPGDMFVPCKEIDCIPATDSGFSVISCTMLMKKNDAELVKCGAKRLGSVKPKLLAELAKFVSTSPVLTEEDKEIFLNAIGDWA